jgi:hypothetical protein
MNTPQADRRGLFGAMCLMRAGGFYILVFALVRKNHVYPSWTPNWIPEGPDEEA